MFNKRSFLLGLGVGIITGALLLFLFELGESNQYKLNDSSNQMEESSGGNKSSEVTPTSSATLSPSPATTPPPSPTQSTLEPTDDSSKKEGQEAAAKEPLTSPSSEEIIIEKYLIRIEPGFKITTTAELLLAEGIINDGPKFIRLMKASKKQIRAGYFLSTKGITEKEAITLVTGEPLSKKEVEKLKKQQ